MNYIKEIQPDDKVDSVRSADGYWINTQCFRTSALHFEKHGFYTPDPWGSPDWVSFWEQEQDRCINGYSVGGARITGDHYFYLNYCQIKLTKSNKGSAGKKTVAFPHFWDYDYTYFHTLDIARNGCTQEELEQLHLSIKPKNLSGGKHMIVGKARRRGYSYKNASICVNRYNTVRNSITLIGAFLKEYLYPSGTQSMANDYIDFINSNTGWAKKMDFVKKAHHKEAAFLEEINGVDTKQGYKSQIRAISFKDNPDAARGKDGTLILLEEGGSFPNLIDSYNATKPTLEDGIYTTGQIIIFGTSSKDQLDSADFGEMFYNPESFGLLSFENIWDKEAGIGATCGFFHGDDVTKVGFVDENGNSDRQGARKWNLDKRAEIQKASKTSDALNGFIIEYPLEPAEAFLATSKNDFPVEAIRRQINRIKANKLDRKGQAVTLVNEGGKVKAIPDLKGLLNPIVNYPSKQTDTTGAVVIWEWPVENPPDGLYRIGFDPYRQHKASTESLGAAYVYKGLNTFSFTGDTLVAEYVGRPNTYDEAYRTVANLAKFYNAEIMFENEVTSVVDYFSRHKLLDYLALQPNHVINANIKNSTVSRTYGIHMNAKLRDAGEKYLKEWLLRERNYDSEGNLITNLETIYSVALLQELLAYNPQDPKVNTDRVFSMFMVMFAEREQEEGIVFEKSDTYSDNMQELQELMKRKYTRNAVA